MENDATQFIKVARSQAMTEKFFEIPPMFSSM